MTIPLDDGPGESGTPRRRDTLLLAGIGLAAALLLFASAAVPVLSERAPDDASGTTSMPPATDRGPASSPVPSAPTVDAPATPPSPPPTTVATRTTAPATPAPSAPSTSSTAPPASTTTTAPQATIPESPPAVSSPRTNRETPAGPLAVGRIDTSTFPRVGFDVVVPNRLAAVALRRSMIEVDGAPVDSVTAVDPGDIAVALVIDDRPTVSDRALRSLQGASLELIRNIGRGTEVALATPSGLASAFTSHRNANTSRIATIKAGSSAVAPLPLLLTSTIRTLTSNPAPDRHAVLLVGERFDASAEQLRALGKALAASGIRLHVIIPDGVDAAAIASISKASGGVVASAPNVIASIDEVTAAIVRRYRAVATVTARGDHEIALTAHGLRYETSPTL